MESNGGGDEGGPFFCPLFQRNVAALPSSSHPGPSTSFPGDRTTQSGFAAELLHLLAKPGEMTHRGKKQNHPQSLTE